MFLMTGLAYLIAATSFAGELAMPSVPELELAIGYTIKDRQLVAVDSDNVFIDGEIVVAWTQVAGLGAGILQHVWYRDGVEIARHDMPIGAGRRWRSWSKHRVQAGTWEVHVLAPDGQVLAKEMFTVEAGDDVGC